MYCMVWVGMLPREALARIVQELGFPIIQLIVHAINNELEVTVSRLLMKNGKAHVFTKGAARLHVQDTRAGVSIASVAVRGEHDLGFTGIDALARLVTEVRESVYYRGGIFLVSIGKESEVIGKEEMEDFGAPMGDFNKGPQPVRYLLINISRESFHAKNEYIGGDRVSLSYTYGRFEGLNFLSID